ncbi:MAG: NAD(P)/FAD-dependent oxidoreductase [Candidatus Binatia bacterium]
MTRVVIVGAGQAGAQVAFSLRQWGFEGKIALVGEENFVPYERPPLSKEFLKEELAEDRLYFRPPDWYAEHTIDLFTGVVVTSIDPEIGIAYLDRVTGLSFDTAVLATGSRPRPLAVRGATLEGIYEVRAIGDTLGLRRLMRPGTKMVVVGAGYIGLEVAAVARSLGVEVTVLEAMDRVLARVTGTVVSDFFEAEHRSRGVDVRCGARVTAFEGKVALSGVRLEDGSLLPCDVAVVGVGVQPRDELARGCGIACDDGIVVDRDARTSNPRVLAVGDCSRRPLVHYGRSGRLESVHNAIEQGKLAAAAILARPRPAEDVPWFWSNQYDLKLQIAGLGAGHDSTVVRGNPADRKFSVFYLRDGALLAVDAINSPMEFMASKQLIAGAARPDPELLGDPAVTMKAIVDAERDRASGSRV